jgi:Glycosyl hydrolase family 47
MHQLTGNPIYREWSWKIFKGIDNNCKVAYGYGSYMDVTMKGNSPMDKQQSFFLAETLKYLYLIQYPHHDISLQKYVLNTEAHPLMMLTASSRDSRPNMEFNQALTAVSGSRRPLTTRRNNWVDHLLKTPTEQVTGTIHDIPALVDGTFSDDFTDEDLRLSDECVCVLGCRAIG